MKLFALLALTVVAVSADEAKHWGVLVAGSNGWYNYRHQADICHAYQILTKNGVPAENIITLMYDDIAHNRENPTPGIIINRPNGPDVYHGVKIDYKGPDVNPDNFLKVLRGDKKGMEGIGSGRVLESGPNDHVFVNFADHGGPGILAFGNKFLHASDMHDAIMYMNKNKHYKQMVWYIEACESGSMFANDLLPDNINAFGTTAANPHESSYACYMDEKRHTYLGDVYSVKWMEDSDKEDLNTETLTKQFQIVKQETNTSHVQEYGDLKMGDLHVGAFQGKTKERIFDKKKLPNPNKDAIPSEDVPLAILQNKLHRARTVEDRERALEELVAFKEYRHRTLKTFERIVSIVAKDDDLASDLMNQRRRLRDYKCYKTIVEYLRESCPKLNIVQNDYGLRHLYSFVNMCERPFPVEQIQMAIKDVAQDSTLC